MSEYEFGIGTQRSRYLGYFLVLNGISLCLRFMLDQIPSQRYSISAGRQQDSI